MIIDNTLSSMENRMDGFRRLDEAIERKRVPDWTSSQNKYRAKKEQEAKNFEARMHKMLNRVIAFMGVGIRNNRKNQELSK